LELLVRINGIDSGQSIWSDSKLTIVKKTKSSGLSEVAAFGKKNEKKAHVFFLTPLQTFGKIKRFEERNYYNIRCQFSSEPYRKVKIDKMLDKLKRKGDSK
jgi:hypothetical protein